MTLLINGASAIARSQPPSAVQARESMVLSFDTSKAVVFDPTTELRI